MTSSKISKRVDLSEMSVIFSVVVGGYEKEKEKRRWAGFWPSWARLTWQFVVVKYDENRNRIKRVEEQSKDMRYKEVYLSR